MKRVLSKLQLLPTTWVLLLFVVVNSYIIPLKVYFVFCLFILLLLWFCTKDLKQALFLILPSLFLFGRSRFFTSTIDIGDNFFDLGFLPVVKGYFVEFADVFLLWVIALLLLKKDVWNKEPVVSIDWLFIIFLLISLISTSLSSHQVFSFFYVWILVKHWLLFIVYRIAFRSKTLSKAVVQSVVLFCVFNSVLIIGQFFRQGSLGIPGEQVLKNSGIILFADEISSLPRPGGLYTSPNMAAALFLMVFPFLMSSLYSHKTIFSNLYANLSLLIIVPAIIFTGSRVVWIILLLQALATQIHMRSKKQPLTLSKTWKSVCVAVLILISPLFIIRLTSLGETLTDPSGGFYYRVAHIKLALKIAQEHIFGVGVNVFQYYIVEHFEPEAFFIDSTPAHNLVAQLLANVGVLGLLVYTIILLKIFLRYLSVYKNDIFGFNILLSFSGYLLACMFHPYWLERPIAPIIWILIAYEYSRKNYKKA